MIEMKKKEKNKRKRTRKNYMYNDVHTYFSPDPFQLD